MKKNEILYNVGLTEKVYEEQKNIDFKAQRLKLIKWIEDKKSDTQGFVATKDNTIYIVWRGSSSKKDFQNDASIDKVPFVEKGEKVHIGFKTCWDAVKDDTYKALDIALKNLGQEHSIDNIVVCGHSLGAAISTLCAYEIYSIYKSNKIICCTIGSPRVGNKTFKENFDKSPIESLRIVNNLDVVTRAPSIGYHHVNTELRIDSEGKIKKWMIDWQRVGEYFKAVFTGKTAKDHMTSNYISALNKWNP
jgi:predicted lipase